MDAEQGTGSGERSAQGAKVAANGAARMRRRGEEVRDLIVAAARTEFAEQGFAGATTRGIARRAGASEVLIYRYFGSKAALFEEAVLGPFNRLLRAYLDRGSDLFPDQGSSETFVRSFYPFLKNNAGLLQALVRSPGRGVPDGPSMHGLDDYFSRASEQMQRQFQHHGLVPEVAPEFGVRFAFGLLASAILYRDWFFPDGEPDEEQLMHALSRLIYKGLSPA